MQTYDEWKTDVGDDDPEGEQHERDQEADEQAEQEAEIARRYRALDDGQVIDLDYVCNRRGHRTIEANIYPSTEPDGDIGYCIDCDEVLPVHQERTP